MRWAKLQQNMNIVYLLAKFKWSVCDANGRTESERKSDLDAPDPGLQPGVYCKYIARDEA